MNEPIEPTEPAEPTRFLVRLSPLLIREIDAAAAGLADFTRDEEIGHEWATQLRAALSALSLFPRRCPVDTAVSRFLGQETRRLLFRQHHVYFTVTDRESDGKDSPDGPQVRALHLRHASGKPMTGKEARDIRGGL